MVSSRNKCIVLENLWSLNSDQMGIFGFCLSRCLSEKYYFLKVLFPDCCDLEKHGLYHLTYGAVKLLPKSPNYQKKQN